MKIALIVIGLMCIAMPGLARPCADAADTEPCTPTKGETKAILENIKAAQQAQEDVDSLETEYRRLDIDPSATAEQKMAAFEAFRTQKLAQDALYAQIIKDTATLYHVNPPDQGPFLIARPDDQAVGWMAGMTATWNPQAIDSGPTKKIAVKITGSDGEDHYGGFANLDTDPQDPEKQAKLAETIPDGRVFILKGTFDLAVKKGNLGFLASVIYHEARHFYQLNRDTLDDSDTKRSWSFPEEDEKDAYAEQNRLANVFRLTPKDKQGFIRMFQYYKKKATDDPTSYNPAPEVTSGWKDVYEGRLLIDGKRQINLEEEYKSLKASVNAARREQERLQREAAERQQRAEARTRLMAAYQNAAARCGMSATMEGDRTIGFAIPDEGEFLFTEPVNLAQAQAALLMANTCWFTIHGNSRPDACADALGELQANWNDSGFMHGLEIDARPSDFAGCMHALRTMPRAPRDMTDLNIAANRHWSSWRDAAKRRALETEREFAEQREEAARRYRNERPDDLSRGGRSHDDNWDLTPAYNALERARRSHF